MHFEEKLLIQELIFRCALHTDYLETEKWVGTFAPDGILDDRDVGFGLHAGREQLLAFGRKVEEGVTHQSHILSNILITDVTDRSAKGTFYGLAESMGPEFGHFRCQVRYEDEYVKIAGEWKISKRVLHPRFPMEMLSSAT